jgi:hypothetical protein
MTMEWIGTGLFALAVLHTFSTKFFEGSRTRHPTTRASGTCSAKSKIVFGFWAMVLMVALAAISARRRRARTTSTRATFTEPMFVFAIMVIAGDRGRCCSGRARAVARLARLRAAARRAVGFHFVTLSAGAPARFLHHRAGRNDAGGADAARPDLRRRDDRRSSSTRRSGRCSSTCRSAAC